MSLSVFHSLVIPSTRSDLMLTPHSKCNQGFVRHIGDAFRFCAASHAKKICRASEIERVAESRKSQMKSTDLLAELLKSDNPQRIAQQHVDLLTEDFFIISSTFVEMARKEGNTEMVRQMESALKVAMDEKGKTLRPEIQILNQLLQDSSALERSTTFKGNLQYLHNDSYFFQILSMMTKDVETQADNPRKLKLLKQLQSIRKEAEKISKLLQKSE